MKLHLNERSNLGYKGVFYTPSHVKCIDPAKPYLAHLGRDLGFFATKEEAAIRYALEHRDLATRRASQRSQRSERRGHQPAAESDEEGQVVRVEATVVEPGHGPANAAVNAATSAAEQPASDVTGRREPGRATRVAEQTAPEETEAPVPPPPVAPAPGSAAQPRWVQRALVLLRNGKVPADWVRSQVQHAAAQHGETIQYDDAWAELLL